METVPVPVPVPVPGPVPVPIGGSDSLKCRRWSHVVEESPVGKAKHLDECGAYAAAMFRNQRDRQKKCFNPGRPAGVYVCPGDPTHWHVGHDPVNLFAVPPWEWLSRKEAFEALKLEAAQELDREIQKKLQNYQSLEAVFLRIKAEKKALQAKLEAERGRRLSARLRRLVGKRSNNNNKRSK